MITLKKSLQKRLKRMNNAKGNTSITLGELLPFAQIQINNLSEYVRFKIESEGIKEYLLYKKNKKERQLKRINDHLTELDEKTRQLYDFFVNTHRKEMDGVKQFLKQNPLGLASAHQRFQNNTGTQIMLWQFKEIMVMHK